MTRRVASRSNEEWLRALQSDDDASRGALDELRAFLHGMMRKVIRGDAHAELDLGDLVQDAMVRVLESADTFRGDSAFTTWAAAIATRVAFTALRRRSARERGEDAFRAIQEQAIASGRASSETEANELHEALHRSIESELTDRQRTAILAELRGLPTVEIAREMEISTNALYKLTHDARKKLRRALHREGHSIPESRTPDGNEPDSNEPTAGARN